MFPAKLTNTILYAAEAIHQERLVHVLGYQNRAENLHRGANAMILPIPAATAMGPDNWLDATAAKHILKDYDNAIPKDVYKGGDRRSMAYGSARSVEVFDVGPYTVALADSAKDIAAALRRFPLNRQPKPNQAIFDAYDQLYPNSKIALCAWDGTLDAEPLLLWYEPKNPKSFFLPALDAHDGNPPKIGQWVERDHTIVVGRASATDSGKHTVNFRDEIPSHLKPFLARKVMGHRIQNTTSLNCDLSVDIESMGKDSAHFSIAYDFPTDATA